MATSTGTTGRRYAASTNGPPSAVTAARCSLWVRRLHAAVVDLNEEQLDAIRGQVGYRAALWVTRAQPIGIAAGWSVLALAGHPAVARRRRGTAGVVAPWPAYRAGRSCRSRDRYHPYLCPVVPSATPVPVGRVAVRGSRAAARDADTRRPVPLDRGPYADRTPTARERPRRVAVPAAYRARRRPPGARALVEVQAPQGRAVAGATGAGGVRGRCAVPGGGPPGRTGGPGDQPRVHRRALRCPGRVGHGTGVLVRAAGVALGSGTTTPGSGSAWRGTPTRTARTWRTGLASPARRVGGGRTKTGVSWWSDQS